MILRCLPRKPKNDAKLPAESVQQNFPQKSNKKVVLNAKRYFGSVVVILLESNDYDDKNRYEYKLLACRAVWCRKRLVADPFEPIRKGTGYRYC